MLCRSNEFSKLGAGPVIPPELISGGCLKQYGFDCVPTPVPIAGGINFTQINAGGQNACGIAAANGEGYCWGCVAPAGLRGRWRLQWAPQRRGACHLAGGC